MTINNKTIIESYRRKNNKDGFCIGDKVKFFNDSDEEYLYVIEINSLEVILMKPNRYGSTVIREPFPYINIKMLKKCDVYPEEIIHRFKPILTRGEAVCFIDWLETKPSNKEYTFFEAMSKMAEGKKIRNTKWREGYYIFVDKKDNLITDSCGLAYEIHLEDYHDLRYFLEWNKGSWEVLD